MIRWCLHSRVIGPSVFFNAQVKGPMSRLETILKNHGTLMISKRNCGFCDASERLFERHGVKPYVIKLEDYPSGETAEILRELRTERKHVTFPAIFYEGRFLGGYDDLRAFYDKEHSRNA